MQCPHCQAPLVPGAAFCVQCGQSITQASAQAPAAAAQSPGDPAAPSWDMGSQMSAPMMPPVMPPVMAHDPNDIPSMPVAAPVASPEAPVAPPMAPSSFVPAGYGMQPPPPGPAQPLYSTQPPPPSQPLYSTQPPPPSQPLYGTLPPSPSQPSYGMLPPSQPLYPAAASRPLYAAPATMPVSTQPQGTPLMTTLFGPNAAPGMAQPYSRIQGLLMRNLSAGAAMSAWLTAALGAVVALIVGLILTALAGTLWSNALNDLFTNTLSGSTSSAGGSLGEYTSVIQQVLTPDLLKLFALAHHVSLNLTGGASTGVGSASGSLSLNLPLTGLFLAPALALTFGGYVAASSDFSRRARFSIARGALMGPFYAVLLAICAAIGSSTLSANSGSNSLLSGFASVTVSPSVGEAVLYGLLWGILFGALGGWIHVSGRVWLSAALATLQTVRRGKLAGALAGAGASLVTAIVLFSAAYIGYAAFSGISGMASSSAATAPSTSPATTMTLYLLFAPVVAVFGFALAAGAPVGTFITTSGADSTLNRTETVSLLNGHQLTGTGSFATAGTTPTHFPPNAAFYVLALGAVVCYLVGGRVAARAARARMAGDGFVAGVLMAVPLAVVMTFATYLAAVGLTLNVSAAGANETLSVSVAASYGGVFLAVLIGGAVCGGLGGASVFAAPGLGALPRALVVLFWPAGKALSPLLDAVTGRDRRQPLSAAMRWVYDGVVVAVVLAVLAAVLDILNGAAPTLVPFGVLWRVEGIVVALLVGLPLVCFLAALVAAFTAPMPVVVAPMPMSMPMPMPMQPPLMAAPPSVPIYATVPASMPGGFATQTPATPYPFNPSAPVNPSNPSNPTQSSSPQFGVSQPGAPTQPPF